jgi:MerR family copper efflux transcriptional regulator
MKISELAERAGITSSAIRYYERANLLPKAQRGANGYRTYDATALERIHFIQIGQQLGFTLEAIRDVAALEGEAMQIELINSFDVRLKDIDAMMESLSEQRSALLAKKTELEAARQLGDAAAVCNASQRGRAAQVAGDRAIGGVAAR